MTYLFRNQLQIVWFLTLAGCGPDEAPQPPPDEQREPRTVERTAYARTIAASGAETCALDWDEDVICWGPDGQSRPFDDTTYSEFSSAQTETGDDWGICAVARYSNFCIGSNVEVGFVRSDTEHIGVGSQGTLCYQFEDKTIQCLGLDEYDLPEVADFDVIVGHGQSFCGLKRGEPPECWGQPLPDVPTSDRLAFTAAGDWCEIKEGLVECSNGADFELEVSDALQISAGPEMVCVLDQSGALFCDGTARALANLPSSSTRFVEIGVGQAHGCGIAEIGEFICWGSWLVDSEEVPVESPADVKAF